VAACRPHHDGVFVLLCEQLDGSNEHEEAFVERELGLYGLQGVAGGAIGLLVPHQLELVLQQGLRLHEGVLNVSVGAPGRCMLSLYSNSRWPASLPACKHSAFTLSRLKPGTSIVLSPRVPPSLGILSDGGPISAAIEAGLRWAKSIAPDARCQHVTDAPACPPPTDEAAANVGVYNDGAQCDGAQCVTVA
jgi:hypothetical protein